MHIHKYLCAISIVALHELTSPLLKNSSIEELEEAIMNRYKLKEKYIRVCTDVDEKVNISL